MRIFLGAMIAAFQRASYIGAHAHGDDKPKRGGTMGRGDDAVSIELVMEEGVVALYVEEHANHAPIPSERMTGWLSLAARGGPTKEVKLVPAGANKLTAPGPKIHPAQSRDDTIPAEDVSDGRVVRSPCVQAGAGPPETARS